MLGSTKTVMVSRSTDTMSCSTCYTLVTRDTLVTRITRGLTCSMSSLTRHSRAL